MVIKIKIKIKTVYCHVASTWNLDEYTIVWIRDMDTDICNGRKNNYIQKATFAELVVVHSNSIM